ncbi:hypothetical protein [Streptomyces cyanogenus]|uniref:Uncharacterized protein n=1 Tax=Streptomyces cyanogenus TaxID=80860 RepID=A0ABX7TMH9_STRCY|nr:hypothetical protein [Streptomyces cyanogenus]QTD97013.1 hypothetical protein S1361_06590 [Streptomyces cyanogenus]
MAQRRPPLQQSGAAGTPNLPDHLELIVNDRPFRDEPTEVLQAALDLANTHAQQAARFRPTQPDDALPAVAGLFQAELQHRGDHTLPAPQGPEYRRCRVCSHIEPEHEPNAGPCLVCDCAGYQLVEASAWIDGDPLMEAIAAAVWEHCRTEGTSLVVDDPRNIAAAVSAVVSPPTSRAELRDRIAEVLVTTSREEWPYTPGQEKWDHHKHGERPGHTYSISCALCTNDVDRLADAVLAVLGEQTDRAAEALATARATNQRLNRRAQKLESELAAYRRAVADWEISDRGTYVPLRTLATIAKAAGIDVPAKWELHHERIERLEAELRRLVVEHGTETRQQDDTEWAELDRRDALMDAQRWYDEMRQQPTGEDVVETHRLALSEALGLGSGAPWDAIRERAAELHAAQPVPGAEQPAAAHSCPNCEGVDPTSCLANPGRQQPAAADDEETPVHACPGPDDNGISPCCGRQPFDFRGEHLTRDPGKVTCRGPRP